MPDLMAAVWSVDTRKVASSPGARMSQLIEAVETAWTLMAESSGGAVRRDVPIPPKDTSTRPASAKSEASAKVTFHGAANKSMRYMFVAPEYLFTAMRTSRIERQNSHFMDEQTKEGIRAELVTLSLRFPDLLLIPGSIGWFKTSRRAELTQLRKRWAHKKTAATRDMTKYTKRYEAAMSEERDFSFLAKSAQSTYVEGDKDLKSWQGEALQNVKSASSPDEIRVAKNTCFVLKSAQIIHRYDKVFEAHDGTDKDLTAEELGSPMLLMPGGHPPFFERDGIRYGLEMCSDHNSASLALQTRKMGAAPVDIQVVMSASTDLEDAHCVASHFIIQSDARGAFARASASDDPIAPKIERPNPAVSVFHLSWK